MYPLIGFNQVSLGPINSQGWQCMVPANDVVDFTYLQDNDINTCLGDLKTYHYLKIQHGIRLTEENYTV